MKSVLKTSNLIHLNSELNKINKNGGFINTHRSEGTHKSEKPDLIT